ncbi:LolA family protein [Turicimonas muris]|uniref:LolA family protein n=1 Tax=Turicimonas muris TaxID=1796652 RepID=UPI0023F05226|nr:outer membrane lipoprotein carrier protein LolA [Turicimonas muris]
MLKKFIAAIGLTMSPLVFASNFLPSYVTDAFEHLRQGSADFFQTKTLSQGLTLKSSGHLSLSNSKGLAWIQTKPFLQKTLINDKSVLLQTQSEEPREITASENPEVYKMVSTLKSLFEGNQANLEKNFSVTVSGNSQIWKMTLIPKIEPLSKIVKEISVDGGKQLKDIQIEEISGAKTLITFGTVTPIGKNEREDFNLAKPVP